jgi:hypothetical protein
MKILFRAYFHQKNVQKKLAENFLGSGSGYGTGSGPFLEVRIRNTAQEATKLSK